MVHCTCTVEPVLRGCHGDKEKVALYFLDRWSLKRASFYMKSSMTGQEKEWPFNTGDCLIEVTAWASLTVYQRLYTYSVYAKCYL